MEIFESTLAELERLEGIRCFDDGSTGFSATWLVLLPVIYRGCSTNEGIFLVIGRKTCDRGGH